MTLRQLLLECLKSGTIASLAMMPFGFAFRAAGMRVGHYGPKFAQLFVETPGPAFLFAQHMVLGWVSVLPLLLLLAKVKQPWHPVATGALYGAGYYVAINALALPLFFGDALPWQLGAAYVVPSLVAHIVFGACAAWVSRRLAQPHTPAKAESPA